MPEMWFLRWLFGSLLYSFFTAAIPSEFGMLVDNDLTFIVTEYLFGGIFPMSLFFLRNHLCFLYMMVFVLQWVADDRQCI